MVVKIFLQSKILSESSGFKTTVPASHRASTIAKIARYRQNYQLKKKLIYLMMMMALLGLMMMML
jgi:hypothetical protein